MVGTHVADRIRTRSSRVGVQTEAMEDTVRIARRYRPGGVVKIGWMPM